MSGKAKNPDVKVLKGQEAEDCVLEYLKRMNRPFGAVDVAANLKGAVAKTATQKILVALAEKGELVQKTYGKMTFFVANQANIDEMPPEKQASLDSECKTLDEENKLRANQAKAHTAELAKLRTSLTIAEIQAQYEQAMTSIKTKSAQLAGLRSGAPPMSEEELAQLDADWTKWKCEWVRRKQVFTTYAPDAYTQFFLRFLALPRPMTLRCLFDRLWQLATDALPPQDSVALAEDLGIEIDTNEHMSLERSALFKSNISADRAALKRKREPES